VHGARANGSAGCRDDRLAGVPLRLGLRRQHGPPARRRARDAPPGRRRLHAAHVVAPGARLGRLCPHRRHRLLPGRALSPPQLGSTLTFHTRSTRMNLIRTMAVATVSGVAALALAGFVANDAETSANALAVDASDSACAVGAAHAPSGTVAFDITNAGSQVTEFYLLADDGLRIVGEVENIAPGASLTLTVTAQPGDYFTLCKPGMVGEGVGRAAFSVTGDAVEVDGPDAELKQQAVDLYAGFVKDQVEALVPAAQAFTD